MGKFDGMYLFSDVDGTLLTRKYELPEKTREAISYFIKNGGHFALATGRGVHPRTREIAEQLGVNCPCILLNGAIIYDFQNEQMLNLAVPNQTSAKSFLKTIYEELSDTHTITVWHPVGSEQLGIRRPYMSEYIKVAPEEISGDIIKIVIGHELPLTEDIRDFVFDSIENGLYVTSSDPEFLEIMPEGVSKGWGVERFIEKYSLDHSKVFTMGDYMNDFSMLSLEGVKSFCPQRAAEAVKNVCYRVLCPVEDSPASEVVSFLENELLINECQ